MIEKEVLYMIILLFRLLIIITVLILAYTFIQYVRSPHRKLKQAIRKKTYFFLDEADNAKKNTLLTYKGCLFEGEKYLGTTTNAFEVVNIHVFVYDPLDLSGITTEDISFLEDKIIERYPYARVEWKHPVPNLINVSSNKDD